MSSAANAPYFTTKNNNKKQHIKTTSKTSRKTATGIDVTAAMLLCWKNDDDSGMSGKISRWAWKNSRDACNLFHRAQNISNAPLWRKQRAYGMAWRVNASGEKRHWRFNIMACMACAPTTRAADVPTIGVAAAKTQYLIATT